VKTHEKYINRCLELAKNGLGTTYPNPLVGSVIVYENKIIGEGWHKKAGEPHAEVNAINSVIDKSLLSKATIYVSLEPCSHFGKTPPCADLIIAHKIPNVVIGTVDPNEKVAGNGIKKLIESGANVTVGVLEDECYGLNKRFFLHFTLKKDHILFSNGLKLLMDLLHLPVKTNRNQFGSLMLILDNWFINGELKNKLFWLELKPF